MSHPGTYVNSPTLGVAGLVIGDPDTAVSFDATSQQYVAQTDTLAAQTLTAFTLGCIISPADPTNNQSPQFWGFEGNNFSLNLSTTSGTGHVHFIFKPAGGFSGTASFSGSTAMSANTTYRLVATWDGTTMSLYVNGSLDGGLTSLGGTGGSCTFGPTQILAGGGTGAWLTDAPVSLYAAADVFNIYSGGTFHGTMDECFFVLNHAATPTEVATIDAAATGTGSIVTAVNALSPYLYWRLGDSSGTVAADGAAPPLGNVFRPPTELTVSNIAFEIRESVIVPPIWNRLMRFYPLRKRGKAVWKLPFVDQTTASAYTFNQPYPWVDGELVKNGNLFPTPPTPDPSGLNSTSTSNLVAQTIDKVFYGGHVYVLTPGEVTGLAAFLSAQGYSPSDWITVS